MQAQTPGEAHREFLAGKRPDYYKERAEKGKTGEGAEPPKEGGYKREGKPEGPYLADAFQHKLHTKDPRDIKTIALEMFAKAQEAEQQDEEAAA